MYQRFDVINAEPSWNPDDLSDLILAGRTYAPQVIGNLFSFWRG